MSPATALSPLSLHRIKMFFDIHVGQCDANDPAECDVLHDDFVQHYGKLRALRGGDQFIIAEGLSQSFINKRPPPAAAEDDDRERRSNREGEGLK